MPELRPGDRLKSQVSEVAVVVITSAGDVTITCGGVEMVLVRQAGSAELAAPVAGDGGSTLLGKRYVNKDDTVEVLCTKGGLGELSCDGMAMEVKHSKALPSSD